ncbi:MAG: SpoIIE family protein phosphatase [Candidatus Sumerlaeaceae bacterium]|nr:SpoIIE family protein phosphatase [Candidatus Sumerlaeaceae bacterium]
MRILVADDDPTSLAILERKLSQWGYEVETARDGDEAWAKFSAKPFPIIVCDWIMPGLTGPELCRRIRHRKSSRYTHIIMVTSKTDTASSIEGLKAGADDYVGKPFDPAELLARLQAGERQLRLEDELANRVEELARANERMKRDLDAAARVQQTLLPKKLPDLPSVDVAWRFRPCEELAGDILNVFLLTPRRLAFYLLDVSGHGVASALLAAGLSRVLTPFPPSVLVDDNGMPHAPSRVFASLNREFPVSDATGGQYFTILYGVLNLDSGVVIYGHAGHPHVILAPANGEPRRIGEGTVPVGFIPEMTYENRTANLAAGDRLVIYSDGVTEAMNDHEEMLGEERLLNYLSKSRKRPLDRVAEGIVKAAIAWSHRGNPEDDISVLALEWKK